MGALRRFLDRMVESDEERLAAEVLEWAAGVPDVTQIGEAPLRQRVKIAGTIRRITVFPKQDHESLEAVISDGSGEAVVVFMGRRDIGGFSLGTKVVVDGVLSDPRPGSLPRMMNPILEFIS